MAMPAAAPADAQTGPSLAHSFAFSKYATPQPLCAGAGAPIAPVNAFVRTECGYGEFALANPSGAAVVAELRDANGNVIASAPATAQPTGTYRFEIVPAASWPAGVHTVGVTQGGTAIEGTAVVRLNALRATVTAAAKPNNALYVPGEDIPVAGTIEKINSVGSQTSVSPAAATFSLRLVTAAGRVSGPYGPFTSDSNGGFAQTIPGAATAGLVGVPDARYQSIVAIEVVDASTADGWGAVNAGAGSATVLAPPTGPVIENSFVSAVGWVKPGEAYPFRVFVKNYGTSPISGASVTIPAADGMRFVSATPLQGSGTASVSAASVSWTIGDVAAGSADGPAVATLVVQAESKGTREDARVVWKDLSTVATLTYTGGTTQTSRSRGPKVIPEGEQFDTARYGFRPFPVVPVDYQDRKHAAARTGDRLANVINSPEHPGSTFNLFQEMSYGQLAPHGTVPAAQIAQAGWGDLSQWRFNTVPGSTVALCIGQGYRDASGRPDTVANPNRIQAGWYQLPGDTHYYGGDRLTFGAAAALGSSYIDNACGPITKAVYDAAHIADPEIDYSDYDTDKDGVVDFFMMVFAGLGGNGPSQRAGYDNIWPHSYTLESNYVDPATGLRGYISSDRLRDHYGRLLFYTDSTRTRMTTTATEFPVFVRVGPYNVNPEAAVDRASVISHEYGHSLGLPDFYSQSQARPTYGDWNLMATDKSQNMDVFSKQELGWVIPSVLPKGVTTVTMRDSKINTHRIEWVQPDGTPYVLEGPNVNNGQAYVARLPGRRIIDPAKVERGASPTHVWFSGQGDNFNCPPNEGHNLDIQLPELANLAPGTSVQLSFKSLWDIEWDWDYGFVSVTTDNGSSYTGLPSANGYSTDATQHDPNGVGCFQSFRYGLTGTSASYAAGTQESDRVTGTYGDSEFITDRYDLSAYAGRPNVVVRFSYFTDAAVARPGWFIDDLTLTANGATLYATDFESEDTRIFNGGCRDGMQTGPACTIGWSRVNSSAGNPADHAYYLELRDRSGFDFDGRGQNDRAAIGFEPGLLVVYTDESHGYGNYATVNPPAQSPLDSTPSPMPVPESVANPAMNLNDAAFTGASGRNRFSDSGTGWVDNYSDPHRADFMWRFDYGCLTFDVLSMSGNVGNSAGAYDLTAEVRFHIGNGCASFDYGSITPANFPPTAVIQVKPASGNTSANFKFDGSRSVDDTTPREALSYSWDFGDGTTATGSSVRKKYMAPGEYTVTLTVRDADGMAGTATKVMKIRAD
ncbi:MAG TPA: PKD domain-containing protein [Candidatus Limnocylindria bacterium]|nr:PKD domain-containing protein [Candidatus Limnocylindria bacterium]